MKKGQAALEFLMTYGWAILVVLAAIAALAYFGILNPSKFTPDTCIASSGVGCLGKPVIGATSIDLSIGSGLGYNVVLNSSQISSTFSSCTYKICDLGGTGCTDSENKTKTLEDGKGVTLSLASCSFSTNANIVKGEIQLNYTNPQSKLTEKIIVGITGKTS